MLRTILLAPLLLLGIQLSILTADPAPAAEVLLFDWPEHPVVRHVIGYLGASLVPVPASPERPTLEARLSRAPFVTGEGRVGLDLSQLDATAAERFRTIAAGGRLEWSTFGPAADRLVGPRRSPRPDLESMRELLALDTDPDWASVRVASLISHDERRVWYHCRRVLETTVESMETGKPLAHPQGTWFLAEHFGPDGTVIETHILSKRPDQEWDYLLYDAQGRIESVSPHLQNMRAPTSCVACHRQARRLPPFADFPDPSEPVNGFLPRVVASYSAEDREILRSFVRTGPREDHLHGTYGGLAALTTRARLESGVAPDWAVALWPRLVKLVPALARRSSGGPRD